MLIGVGVFVVLTTATVVWFAPVMRSRRPRPVHYIGATLLTAWTVGAGAKIYLDSTGPADSDIVAAATRVGPIEWRDEPGTVPATPPISAASASGAVNAGSVQSLIGGLEARLTANPADAQGWALLAQSYAFVGDTAGAERAVQHAVELGMDETSLRERVRLARREVHPTNWIREAVGG